MKKGIFFLLMALIGVGLLSAQTIDFEIRNEQYTNSNTQYEFDIYMGADVAGTYHSSGIVALSYNTAAFGDSVVTNANMTSEHLALLNEVLVFSPTTKKYATVEQIDKNTNTLKLGWQSLFITLTPGSLFHTEVPASMTPLYHITLDVTNSVPPPNIAFEFGCMIDETNYLQLPSIEVPYANGYLPVELLEFSAKAIDEQHIELNWVTGMEQNNDFFVIEKSRENGKFESLGKLSGLGNSDQATNYQFIDDSPMGHLNSYRLMQVDFDGSATYSEVVEIYMRAETSLAVKAYPSPSEGIVWLESNISLKDGYQVTVCNLAGISMEVASSPVDDTHAKLDLSSFPEGVYIIRLVNKRGRTAVNKVVKY